MGGAGSDMKAGFVAGIGGRAARLTMPAGFIGALAGLGMGKPAGFEVGAAPGNPAGFSAAGCWLESGELFFSLGMISAISSLRTKAKP